jgi:hypothetical protein
MRPCISKDMSCSLTCWQTGCYCLEVCYPRLILAAEPCTPFQFEADLWWRPVLIVLHCCILLRPGIFTHQHLGSRPAVASCANTLVWNSRVQDDPWLQSGSDTVAPAFPTWFSTCQSAGHSLFCVCTHCHKREWERGIETMYDGTRIYRIMTSAGSRMEGFQPFFFEFFWYDPDLICCYDLFVAWFCSYDYDMIWVYIKVLAMILCGSTHCVFRFSFEVLLGFVENVLSTSQNPVGMI